MPEISQEVLEECAYVLVEDLVLECLLESDEPMRTGSISLRLKERGLDVSAAFLRGFFQDSSLFVSDGRRWDMACRGEAEGAAMDGAMRTLLRGRGRPMLLDRLCHQVALAKTLGPKEAAGIIEPLIRSRDAYFITDDGRIGIRDWVLKTGGDSDEEILLDNFFDAPEEAEDVFGALDDILGNDDETTMLNALEVLGCPLTLLALQLACYKRDPEHFDPIAHLLAILDSDKFIVYSDHQVVPSSIRPDLVSLVEGASAAQADVEAPEEEAFEGDLKVSPTDVKEAMAFIGRRGRSVTLDLLVMELFEISVGDPGFTYIRGELEDALDQQGSLLKLSPGRYTAPGTIPGGLDTAPLNLVPDTVSVVALSGDDIDVEMADPGLDGDLADRVHDPAREDIGEDNEVVLHQDEVVTPSEISWIVPYHHYLSGTIKVRKMDGNFYGGRRGLADCAFHYEQGGEIIVCWANLDLGLVFGLKDFYKTYCQPSGAVLRITARPMPGEYTLAFDGESDEQTVLNEDTLANLLKLRADAEARRLSIFDVMCSLLPFHEEGATLERIHAEVNAVRRTTKRLVASILSYYQCFHPRGRNSELWIFDERKVEQGRSRSKRKYVIKRS